LESIGRQGLGDWEIVICEDRSPRRAEIAEAVSQFCREYPELRVHFYSNEENIGYDANLRRLLDRAVGDYCVFVGDDDLLAPGALVRICEATTYPNVGVVLRAWTSVGKESGKQIEDFRYFKTDRLFSPGIESVAALYRRSVFFSGLTVLRAAAKTHHTDRFDGTLLYQLYLVGQLLMRHSAYYISNIVVLRRVGGEHYFGSSAQEKANFCPGRTTVSHSLAFVTGMLNIARALDGEMNSGLFKLILQDISRYSYPLLEIQAQQLNRREFRDYAKRLAKLGLGKSPFFWGYYVAIRYIGVSISNLLIRKIKQMIGRTPQLGGSKGMNLQ
jgi:glycosyltransferase involved in cell wall biosynthesis